jgi:hypothetical protein
MDEGIVIFHDSARQSLVGFCAAPYCTLTRWINLLEKDGWVYASRRRPDDPKRTDAVTIVAFHCEAIRPG